MLGSIETKSTTTRIKSLIRQGCKYMTNIGKMENGFLVFLINIENSTQFIVELTCPIPFTAR